MRTRVSVLAAVLALLAAGCGGGGDGGDPTPTSTPAGPPVLDRQVSEPEEDEERERAAPPPLGFPGFATKNTTRVAGDDPVDNAAGAALAAFPAASKDSRPLVVTLADAKDWRSAISAAQLMSAPLRAPVLLSGGGALSRSTAATLERLAPLGTKRAGGSQVVRAGAAAAKVETAFETTDVPGTDAAEVARGIDRIHTSATGAPSRSVIVAPSQDPDFAMPAAGLAVHTGAPVLWTNRERLPQATVSAIEARRRPRIYVIGPRRAVSEAVVERLTELGTVRRIAGADPAANAIAVARYQDGAFGWGVVDPGHGLVIASADRTADAAAAAVLSGTGTYGPLLLVTDGESLPAALQGYLLDIQPGYDTDPVRGVYNHGWLMGDEKAISTAVQARIDSLLEIQPVDRSR